jgi:hypothetical protein
MVSEEIQFHNAEQPVSSAPSREISFKSRAYRNVNLRNLFLLSRALGLLGIWRG